MNEAIKEALLEHGYSLYQKEWVEETATEGYERMIQNIRDNYPNLAEAISKSEWLWQIIYFTAFEDSLNTFFLKCIEDNVHKVELQMNELSKITARIKGETPT